MEFRLGEPASTGDSSCPKECDDVRILVVMFLLLLTVPTHARTWVVDQAGGGDFTLVRDALIAAAANDSVVVHPGTYEEYDGPGQGLVLEAKPLTLLGTGGSPEETSLRFSVAIRNTSTCLIENLRFFGEDLPLAFRPGLNGGQLVVRRCKFDGNDSSCLGGAIYAELADLVAEDCEFTNNRIDCDYAPEYARGGAINAERAVIRRCQFSGNEAGWAGGAVYCWTHLDLEDCVFLRNKADHGAAVMAGSVAGIRRCTFYANEIHNGSGAALESWGVTWDNRVSHCIVAGTINGWGVECTEVKTFECCDVWANDLGDFVGMWCNFGEYLGNFSADPLFCDPAAGDLGLREGSPCLPGNHGDDVPCGLVGARGLGCDLVPVLPMTWGRLKALYR